MKIGRNEKCPCGSGKKYKKCCMNNTDDKRSEKKEKFSNLFKEIKKESKIKHCISPDKANCSEKIIKAHSIQNNKILNKISTNGYVFMPQPKSDNPFEPITKYGRKEATVFTGFCKHHDTEIFKDIENTSFDNSELHIFLYTYRCFAVEYHKKMEVSNMEQVMLKKKPTLSEIPEDNLFLGMKLAVKDFENDKLFFDKALLEKNYSCLTSIVWEFDGESKFAGTGFEVLEYDLKGLKIQNTLDRNKNAEHVFMCVFPEDNRTYAIISWLKKNDKLFKSFKNQLENLSLKKRKNYIDNSLPVMCENIVINPDAWEALNDDKKTLFYQKFWMVDMLSTMFEEPIDRLREPECSLFDL